MSKLMVLVEFLELLSILTLLNFLVETFGLVVSIP